MCYLITGMFRSSNYDIDLFLSELLNYLSNTIKSLNHIICGNININILDITLKSSKYLNIFAFNQLFPYINNDKLT